jgi:hypothetical protein
MLAAAAPGGGADLFVALEGAHQSPYSSWATAATNIQAAVDAASVGDTVWATNGVYEFGGRLAPGETTGLTNRVVVDKPVVVRSVNGPEVTVIRGYQAPGVTNGPGAIRCVYLANGASLIGFTITRGATLSGGENDVSKIGGGIWAESANALIRNCIITRNSAFAGGGGVYRGTLNNCALTANSAWSGGAAAFGTLNNCTVTGNSAARGGGTLGASLNNCILFYNQAPLGSNYESCTLTYTCSTPLPPGLGNLAVEPRLAGNFRLSSDSPCRGVGSAAYAAGVDVDGEPWAAPPSLGCDEYWSGSVTGALSVAIPAPSAVVVAGVPVSLTVGSPGA